MKHIVISSGENIFAPSVTKVHNYLVNYVDSEAALIQDSASIFKAIKQLHGEEILLWYHGHAGKNGWMLGNSLVTYPEITFALSTVNAKKILLVNLCANGDTFALWLMREKWPYEPTIDIIIAEIDSNLKTMRQISNGIIEEWRHSISYMPSRICPGTYAGSQKLAGCRILCFENRSRKPGGWINDGFLFGPKKQLKI